MIVQRLRRLHAARLRPVLTSFLVLSKVSALGLLNPFYNPSRMSTPVSDDIDAPPNDPGRQRLVELPAVPPHDSNITLPSQPLVVVEATPGWSSVNLREIWRYRELLYFLAWRDVKVRYKQTLFGIVWVIMQPLLSTLVFTFVLGKLARVPSDGLPYPVFVYAGLLPWVF